ncbi:hypothetical protein PG993_004642 [Apiospora rasikravindrae]|uniref:Clr5 domain-containing protein n=1 Tax=Apiospora rasikravindrae TaxID=990691 RepID=A0ABR1TDE9_9PEZI
MLRTTPSYRGKLTICFGISQPREDVTYAVLHTLIGEVVYHLPTASYLSLPAPCLSAFATDPTETAFREPAKPSTTKLVVGLSAMAWRESRGQWASQADWDRHRPLISHLYIEEGKPLKEVMDILEKDHGFKATAKMYKVEERKQPPILKADRPSITGPSGQAYSDNAVAIKIESAADILAFSKRSGQAFGNTAAYPHTRFYTTPDATTLTEAFLRLSNQFMVGNAEMQVGYASERTIPWWGQLESAARLLDSQDYRGGLSLLSDCFDKLGPLLQNPEPTLIPSIYLSFLRLPPELKRHFITFVAKLAGIKLPKGHPLVLMWNKFRESETGDLERNAYYAIKTHFDIMEDSPYRSKAEGILIAGRTYDMFDFIKDKDKTLTSDTEEIITRSRSAMQALEKLGNMEAAVTLKTTLGYLYWRHKRYDEARALATEVLQWRQSLPPEGRMLWLTYHPLRLLYLIEWDTGTWDGYKKYSHEYLQLCYKGEGPEHHRTKTSLLEVQRSYRERGLEKEADELPGSFLRELEYEPG